MGTRHTLARFESYFGLLAVAVVAFAASAFQSFLDLTPVPNAVVAIALGVPFAAGLILGWRAVLFVIVGSAAWLLLAAPVGGWLILPAAALESAAGAWQTNRFGERPVLGSLIAVGVRGAAVGALLALTGHASWLIAAAATVALGFPANAILSLAAGKWQSGQSPGRLDLLKSAVVHARDAVVVLEAEPSRGPGRSVLYVNDAFTRMTGYAVDEVLGRSLHFLRGPRSCPDTLDRIKDALATGIPLQVELLNYCKNGSELWVELSLVPVHDEAGRCLHWVMIQRDASGRKRAEEELRDREQRLRVLGDNLPGGAVCQVVAEPGGLPRFTYVSAGIKRLTGLDAETLLADPETAHSLVYPDDKPRFMAAGKASARDLTPFDCESRMCQPDGGVKWVHFRSMPQRLADGRTLWNGVMMDITEQRRLEDQLRQIQKMEAIGRMAGGIAHDFNNLLTGVIGNLARTTIPIGDPNTALIDAAVTAANRAADLTRKLLGFARKNQLVVAPVRIGEFVDEVVDILGRTFDPRIRIVTDVDDPGMVMADAALINQSVLNLCLNARDAMPDGGTLTIQVASEQVDARTCDRYPDTRPGACVRLTVMDTGVGMTPEVKSRIFEPFFTTKAVGQGTGLGLPMVQGVIEQHNGWIECQTAPGNGTRFDLYLPRTSVAANGPPARLANHHASPPPDVVTPPPVGSRTVLLVDDEDMIRSLARSVLEQAGYRVIEAPDGAAAVDLFRGDHTRIDLVVLDLMMPRLSGRDAFRSMIAIAPNARIIFSSGYSPDDLSDVSGAVGLLAKPYRPQELVAAVQRALETRTMADTPAV